MLFFKICDAYVVIILFHKKKYYYINLVLNLL